MCCQSKKKPVTVEANPQKDVVTQSTVPVYTTATTKPVYTSNMQTSVTNAIPKSTISFTANDYDSAAFTNQAAYVSTKKVTHYVQDRGDRFQDYSYEINKANNSKLIL